ncbi:hypothetical protein AB0F30_16925 [Streptomyces sp. NPDC029006]|uniref:hypothetical protein n=1 Tax=Streptomyces sp. NPDC029006 TaxID=3155467 RepID=UPI0033FBFB6D
MRDVCRGWAAGLLVAAVVGLAGCGGGSDKADGKASASPSVATSTEVPETPASEDTEPVYPSGPEGEIDQKADTERWTYDDSTYSSASEYVQDICNSLPEQTKDSSPAQWLAEAGYMNDDGVKILTFGVPKLCPKWSKTVRQAVAGTYERWISLGEFEVKVHPKPFHSGDEVQEIGPGTYQAAGHFSSCYWERTTQGGDIIANQFVTQATRLTVTLRAGELFKNECGTFKPVG